MHLQYTLPSIFVAFAAAAKEGWTGTIKSLDGGLEGTFTVANDSALTLSGYQLKDASAPALYWWGSTSDDLSAGFRINNQRVDSASSADSIVIPLDAGHGPADFNYAGLWCERFKTNFGQAKLTEPGSSTGDGQAKETKGSTGAAAGVSSKFAVAAAFTAAALGCALSLA